MPHYTETQIQAANQTDLVAFLMSRGEKLKHCGNQYLWERHQVWLHGYEWYTHYESKGGYAVSFVMRYYGLPFQDAVAELIGDSVSEILPPKYQPKSVKALTLPQPNATMNHVYAYLMEKRFIARDVITHFAKAKTLYEDAQYHNCIFLGLDEEGVPKHCHRRATGSNFKCTEAGSQAEYAFHHDGESEWLFVFEAPVDMLAFITLHQNNWHNHSYVALCSVSERAILHRLQVNPELTKIVLCLDNDNAAISACHRIKGILESKGYNNVRMLHSVNKDWDEDVKAMNGISPIPAEADETEAIRKLCAKAIEEAEALKMPPMLYRKTCDAYTALINAHEYNRKQQIEHFLGLLLLLAKDECRKSLEPIERALLTPDELKSLPKGTFCVMKTGFYPMQVKLKLFFKWGIVFPENVYVVPDKGNRAVSYANREILEAPIATLYPPKNKSVGDKMSDDEKAVHKSDIEAKSYAKTNSPPRKPGQRPQPADTKAEEDKDEDTEASGDSMPMSQSNLPAGEETDLIINREGDIVDERIRNDIYG